MTTQNSTYRPAKRPFRLPIHRKGVYDRGRNSPHNHTYCHYGAIAEHHGEAFSDQKDLRRNHPSIGLPQLSLTPCGLRQRTFDNQQSIVVFHFINYNNLYFLTKFSNFVAMRIDIITVLPEMLEGFVNESILARAQKKGLAEIHLHNLRDYTTDKWRRVDDYPYGGFAGMVMQCEPIDRAISALKAERNYDEVIFTSPDGEQFNQHVANDLSMLENIIILCGHYKGIDQRVRDHLITREISIGDYVLTGGELAAAVMADAIVRVVPGVIGDEQSALSDCFQDDMLSAPIYTRPADYKGWKVPDILLSGNEAKIKEWEMDQAMERTRRLRPDLLK